MLKRKRYNLFFNFISFSLATLIIFNSPAWATTISVRILKPTPNQLLCGMTPFTIPIKGVVSIPENPEKEQEAIIVWQIIVEGTAYMTTTKSGQEGVLTVPRALTQDSSYGTHTLHAIINKFQVVGNNRYHGENALKVVIITQTGENYEGYIVNSTDPSEQDMVIGQRTDELEGCVHFIEGYCIHAEKGIPDSGLVFLQPWTSENPNSWAYWIKKTIRYANQHRDRFDAGDKLAACWYITDRAGSYNELLREVGYPENGPTREWETDTTPPSTPVVTDDGDTINTPRLHAKWSSEEPESAIAKYEYAIGTNPGKRDVVDWTSIETNEVTRTDLRLANGQTYYFTVKAMNEAGLWSAVGYSDGIKVIIEPFSKKTVYNYPNPFNPDKGVTNIRFSVEEESDVTIEIFDVAGDLVWRKELRASPGVTLVPWDGKNEEGEIVANGVYIYRVTADGKSVIKKIAVLR